MESHRGTRSYGTRKYEGTALREKGVHTGGGQASQQEWKGKTESGLSKWSRERINEPELGMFAAPEGKAKECSKSNLHRKDLHPPPKKKASWKAREVKPSNTVAKDCH